MASHVTIVDSSARRTMIRVQPGTYLSDVLNEVCTKLKLSPDQFTLRHNKKPVDLSRTFRLSGLVSGAQLELVQGSRSPTVINIAIQLPEADGGGRLTDKFPSTTSFWQVLRRFESGTSGGAGTSLNITQRGSPQMQDGATGAGRLYYEMPVINVMGRELGSFIDLQKTLGSLGFTGSALLRLVFRNSGKPLEEAMLEISQYFKESEDEKAAQSQPLLAQQLETPSSGASIDQLPFQATGPEIGESSSNVPSATSAMEGVESSTNATESRPSLEANLIAHDVPTTNTSTTSTNATPNADVSQQPIGSGPRNVRVFHAPSSNTPLAAAQGFNESDFVPTMEHAQAHQARLNTEGRNRRLASDNELAAQEKERQERLAQVKGIKLRIKFPDMESVEMTISRDDTAAEIYSQIRSMMSHPAAGFDLKMPGSKGPQLVVLPESNVKVITEFGWHGAQQIHMLWRDDTPPAVRQDPCLTEQWRSQRQEFDKPLEFRDDEADKAKAGSSKASAPKGDRDEKKLSVEDKMKKFLRFGKK